MRAPANAAILWFIAASQDGASSRADGANTITNDDSVAIFLLMPPTPNALDNSMVSTQMGIVAEAIQTLHDVRSPSLQRPSVATGNTGMAFRFTNEIPMYSPTM
jgi:hypothetical protein